MHICPAGSMMRKTSSCSATGAEESVAACHRNQRFKPARTSAVLSPMPESSPARFNNSSSIVRVTRTLTMIPHAWFPAPPAIRYMMMTIRVFPVTGWMVTLRVTAR